MQPSQDNFDIPITTYLDSWIPCDLFRKLTRSYYFVDKSQILEQIIPCFDTSDRYLCVTRPRRFGKTSMACLLASFVGMHGNMADVFDKMKISSSPCYHEHLNNHHVFYMDMSSFEGARTYQEFIGTVMSAMKSDLRIIFPSFKFDDSESVFAILKRLGGYGKRFVFILDEWDAIFQMSFMADEDCKNYLYFIRDLLKDKPYVEFAYMTGVMPIAKLSSGSALNMFRDETMTDSVDIGAYFGFTENEVDYLYQLFVNRVGHPNFTREELKYWYDGYQINEHTNVYNPRSVVMALIRNTLSSYWTESGPYDEVYTFIRLMGDEVRKDLEKLIAGEGISVEIGQYSATSRVLKTRDEVYSAMVVFGMLNYDGAHVRIPNHELMLKFISMLKMRQEFGYLHRLARNSEEVMQALLEGDAATVSARLELIHDTEIPLIVYNDENSLACIVNLLFLQARNNYDVVREDRSGKGYVDFIFYPEDRRSQPGIILELKVNSTPEAALQQIRDRNYLQKFCPGPDGGQKYAGPVFAVGIAYDTEKKTHACKIERLEIPK